MKKHRCPVCMRHKLNMNVVIPCKHIVCFDCLSVWVGQAGQNCPYCRSPFDSSYSIDKDGNIKADISNVNFSYDISHVNPPKGSSLWTQELRRKWPQILDNVCRCLIDLGIKDNTTFFFIIKTISDFPREEAKAKIGKYIGQLCPNIFEKIMDIQIIPQMKNDASDDLSDQFQ